MEDNERTRELKEDASSHIVVVEQAVDAVQKVDELIASNAADSQKIMDSVKTLTILIDHYRTGKVIASETEGLSHG